MSRPLALRNRMRQGRLAARALGLALLLGTAFGGGVAQAGTDSFCNQNVASGTVCTGPNHTLTAVRGWNNTSGTGCGGAVGYGSYYCATPAGCHTYSAGNVLVPGIRHRSITAKNMSGYSTWGATGAPSYCDPGSPYAVAGPVGDEAAYTDGIPVLARPVTKAPADVADLTTGADASKARRFETPGGSGWVLVDAATRRLCVAIDDAGTGYGYSCQRLGDARATGSLQTLEDDDLASAAGDVVVALPPEGVDAVSIERVDGSTRKVAVQAGVAVVTLTAKDAAVEVARASDAPAGTKAQRLVMVAGSGGAKARR